MLQSQENLSGGCMPLGISGKGEDKHGVSLELKAKACHLPEAELQHKNL
jgi:hypothetical protein